MRALTAARLSVALLLAVLAPPAHAWNEPPDFQGIPWGASMQEARQTALSLVCVAAGRCRTFFDLAAVRVYAFLSFREGRFDQVDLTFAALDFDRLKAAFVERYGEPTARQLVPLGGGQALENEILEWTGRRVHIALRRYGRGLDLGTGVIRAGGSPAGDGR